MTEMKNGNEMEVDAKMERWVRTSEHTYKAYVN